MFLMTPNTTPEPEIERYKRDHFKMFLNSLAEGGHTEPLVMAEVDSLLRAFREDCLHPVAIGELLRRITEQPEITGDLKKMLADFSWDLSQSDDWTIFVNTIGKMEMSLRKYASTKPSDVR